jgi:hypothetical protein
MALPDGGRLLHAIPVPASRWMPLSAPVLIPAASLAPPAPPQPPKIGIEHVGKIIQIGRRGIRAFKADLDLVLTGGNEIIIVKGFRKRGVGKALEQLPAGARSTSSGHRRSRYRARSRLRTAETEGLTYQERRYA